MQNRATSGAPGTRAHQGERNGGNQPASSQQTNQGVSDAVNSRQAWAIAASLFVALFFLWGGGYNTGPIFLAALLKAFGWSHERVGSIIGALALAVGISAPIAGWLLDRIEARWVMGTGAIIAVLGLVGASSSHAFTPLFVSIIVLGIGLGAATWLAASLVIVNWFPDRRGMALGLVTFGMESGGMVMTFTVGNLIAGYGWRTGYFAVAVPALILVVPLLLWVVRTRPANNISPSVTSDAQALPGYEFGEALRTRAFWMLALAELSFGLAAGGTFHHLVAFLEGLHYTLRAATLVVSIVLGMAAVGKVAMGALGDRIGGKNALGIGFTMIAVSVPILLNADQPLMLVLWLIIVGIAGASPVALGPLLTAETLGLKRFGTLFGWLGFALTFGLFIGPQLVGWLTDMTGSYTAGYELCGLICVVGAVASFLCVPPRASAVPILGAVRTQTS
ncbi:MAG TPA: MFS transporter [Candidatus Binataceae bacterium]|nr:MFS transporter [Candidatus Binataceae bacterium]